MPANDLAIHSCYVSTAIASLLFSLALRPSVFSFFGPLTFRVTRRAAYLKFIAKQSQCSAYSWPPNSFACATLSIAIANCLSARLCGPTLSRFFGLAIPPVYRGATPYLIALNLAIELLSTNDWTRCSYIMYVACLPPVPRCQLACP